MRRQGGIWNLLNLPLLDMHTFTVILMLVDMCMMQNQQAYRVALITTEYIERQV